MAREGEGVGVQVLDRLGVGNDRVLAQVLKTRRASPGEEIRPVAIGRQMPVERPVGIRSIVSRLDEITERLSAIENLLAEMREPAARPRKPASGGASKPRTGRGKPAGGAQRNPPAGGAEPPGGEPPAAQA
jgi:hypothetical protein